MLAYRYYVYVMIGIDEVGRGAWAGPLLVVAVRQTDVLPEGLKDSKLLTKKRRKSLSNDIAIACEVGEGWVTPSEVDEMGLTRAMYLGVERALTSLDASFSEEIIVDGNINYCSKEYIQSRCVIDADDLFPIVSAASIYAKVARDEFMTELVKTYPDYGFEKHVGYGTKLHIDSLKRNGVTNVHRKSYKPVKAFTNAD